MARGRIGATLDSPGRGAWVDEESIMQAKAKTNTVVTTRLIPETGVIEFTVLRAAADGQGAATMALDPRACHEAVRARAVVHGLVARIVDRAALDRNRTTGQPATGAEKFAAMKVLVDHYMGGSADWQMKASARSASAPVLDPILLAAVSQATGRPAPEVLDMIARGSAAKAITPAAYLAALGTSAKVAPIVERLRTDAAGGLDGDALLDEAMEGEEEGEASGEGCDQGE